MCWLCNRNQPWHEAYRKRVLLLSPSNLIVSLKLTADGGSRNTKTAMLRKSLNGELALR
ncbi:MAG: hypothetical protein ACLU30_06820 [Odoribacter splanchnicus]